MDLGRHDHATGVIRLVSIGPAGLCAGNPKRARTYPTAEHRRETFQELTLTSIGPRRPMRRHLSPLSPVPQHVPGLLDLPVDML
jgi:hypothetical protein